MNEEAGFIAALLAEPNDRTTLLVYADWLDERNDPRAEYLRLLASKRPDQRRLGQLRREFDLVWALAVTNRVSRGCPVRIAGPYAGAFTGHVGEVTDVRLRAADDDTLGDDEVIVVVRITIWGRPLDLTLSSSAVERASPPTA